jgi:hypothetical protein
MSHHCGVDGDLVDVYWRLYRSISTRAGDWEETFWAHEAVEELVEHGDFIGLLIDLAAAAPGDDALAYLGAGPVEDALSWRWADSGHRLEGAIAENEPLRRAATSAILPDELPPKP